MDIYGYLWIHGYPWMDILGGLWNSWKLMPLSSENQIFEVLGMDFQRFPPLFRGLDSIRPFQQVIREEGGVE